MNLSEIGEIARGAVNRTPSWSFIFVAGARRVIGIKGAAGVVAKEGRRRARTAFSQEEVCSRLGPDKVAGAVVGAGEPPALRPVAEGGRRLGRNIAAAQRRSGVKRRRVLAGARGGLACAREDAGLLALV